MFKNVASQKVPVYAYDKAAGAPKTGDAANITAYISKDGAEPAVSNDVNPTELDATNMPGVYLFDTTQSETDCDLFLLSPVSTTANIELEPVSIFTMPANFTALGIESDGDLSKVNLLDGHTPQTGDNYARLGAPAGASVSADVAAVKVDTSAIDTKTTNLPADPASETNVNANETKIDTAITNIAALDTKLGTGIDLGDGTTIANMLTSIGGKSADAGTFDRTTDSLEAIVDGGAAGLTAQQVRDAMKLAPTGGAPDDGSIDKDLDDIVAVLPTSGRISNLQIDTTFDGVRLDKSFEYLNAMFNGKFTKDEPVDGQVTFTKRDNATPLSIISVTTTERNRIL